MVSQEDIDNFDMEEEKEETASMKKRHKDARALARVGFIVGLSALALVLGVSFINNCLILSKNINFYYRFTRISQLFLTIGYFASLVGMIISIIAYVQSAKTDVSAKVYSAVGISIGAIQTWALLVNVITVIAQR